MIDTARPLYDDIAEQGILGAILCRPECFEDVALAGELTANQVRSTMCCMKVGWVSDGGCIWRISAVGGSSSGGG